MWKQITYLLFWAAAFIVIQGCVTTTLDGNDVDTSTDSDSDSDSDTDTDSDSDSDTDTETETDTSVCGDGETTGAEDCDDSGESATCDDDCTAVECGDGYLNETAGETCDDSGESATCDDDCTVAECGDGTVNTTAGEDCDDSDESATCDDDCTDVVCGDLNVNETAGEECDDGDIIAGDGCDDQCLLECVTNSLTTTYAGGNGFSGNMFDITTINEVIINSFDVNLDSSASATIEVYYRDGTYVGHTSSSAGWNLLGSTSVTSAGDGIPTVLGLTLGHTIPASTTQGFYVTSTTSNMNYTDGSTPTSNADMTLTFGYGGAYPFNLTNTPRIWNGTIHYDVCN